MNRELKRWKHAFLCGTVGSIRSLYRPVWHRMGDYACVYRHGRGETETLQIVAPGIAEALIATAGLVCLPLSLRL